jgi:Tannase and feruloyl esterase
MQKQATLCFAAALVGSATIIPAVAKEKPAPPLPTCLGNLGTKVAAIVPNTLPGKIVQGIVNPKTGAVGPGYISVIPAAPEQPAGGSGFAFLPTPIGPTPAFCQVAFVYYPGGEGPTNAGPGLMSPGIPEGQPAYDVGQKQAIEIVISLPLNSADGGGPIPGAVNGAWSGGVMTQGSPGMSGSLNPAGFGEGLDGANSTYAIRQGFIASITDAGEQYAGFANQGTPGSANFAIISTPGSPNLNKIAYGTVADWIYRGTWYGRQWADAIAAVYYGTAPKLHYYNGGSGAGNMGMGQLQNHGDEYDGFLIGAPAYRWQQFRLADSWPNLVLRKLVQVDGAAALPTSGQQTALYNAIVAACDVEGTDTVADGLIADPRVCTLQFTATANICGRPTAPAAPNCLTAHQAASFDRIFDGPRNSHGARIWYPYDISITFPANALGAFQSTSYNSAALTGSTVEVVRYDHANAAWPANNCLFVDQESLNLSVTNATGWAECLPPGVPTTYEQEAAIGSRIGSDLGSPPIDLYTDNQIVDLKPAEKHGTKVIQIHGSADPAIRWRHDVDYYNRVATTLYGGTTAKDYEKLQRWYRMFVAPMTGHIGGGFGPYWFDPFVVLRNWVEHGVEPKTILGLTNSQGINPGRTRPMCPFPQTAIYSGFGSTDDANSFTCGGNLEAGVIKNALGQPIQGLPVACNDVKTVFGQEDSANLDFKGVGLTAEECATYLPAPHEGTPTSPTH